MFHSVGKWPAYSVVTLLVVSLTACQNQPGQSPSTTSPEASPVASTPAQLFPDNFAQVCSDVPLERAAAYDKTPGSTHPIYVFTRDDANQSFAKSYSSLPEGWEKAWEQSQETQLVACITTTGRQLADKCEFEPDEPGETAYTLEIYNTNYEVNLYAAQTAEKLASTTFELEAGECPMFHMFTEGEPVDTQNANFDQPLLNFVKPYVQPEA